MQAILRRVGANYSPSTSPRSPHKIKIRPKEFRKWSVDEVCSWLEQKGLAQYAEHFRRSKVNGESLAGLTEHQMRQELKVTENSFHLRSLVSARNALLGSMKDGANPATAAVDATRHWSIDDVALWLESNEIVSLREMFKKNAIHGAMLLELTREDVSTIGVTSSLLSTKVVLLIQQLASQTTATVSRDKRPLPLPWNTTRVGEWLDSIGLTLYKDAFESNSIDGLMLAHIDDSMLTQLGVHNALHRRSVTLALAQLTGGVRSRASKRDRVCDWDAGRVAEWLASNDFDDRKLVFRSNGVHGALLVALSDVDLASRLGMSNSIERARLLRDIRRLCGEPSDLAPQLASAAAASPARVAGKRDAVESVSAHALVAVDAPRGKKAKGGDKHVRVHANNDDDNDAASHYGVPPPPLDLPPPPADAPPCSACNAVPADCALGPCGHRAACSSCAPLLDLCPRCSRVIDSYHVF